MAHSREEWRHRLAVQVTDPDLCGLRVLGGVRAAVRERVELQESFEEREEVAVDLEGGGGLEGVQLAEETGAEGRGRDAHGVHRREVLGGVSAGGKNSAIFSHLVYGGVLSRAYEVPMVCWQKCARRGTRGKQTALLNRYGGSARQLSRR